MTKSHILLYALTVVGITIGAYLYTSTAEAPHSLTVDESVENIPEASVVDTNQPETPIPTTPAETEANLFPPTEELAKELIGSTWQWSHTEDLAGQKIFTPKNSQAFKMQFTAERMSSATDCNTIGGSYDLVGTKLVFGPLMSTLMYCEGSEESTYGAGLNAVTGYQITDGKLLLKSDKDEVMVFKAIEI